MTVARHLFLVGFMGAGKSTVGELVAGRLHRPFVDLDALIESEARTSVAEIFATGGEEGFRELESSALLSLESRDPAVVACGGGIVLRAENRAVLKRLGAVVYLKVTAGEAVARIDDASTRPLLAGSGGSLAATTLLAARESLYTSVADLVVDTMGQTPSQVAEDVVAAYESGGM
jgi:shikimate kinase